MSIINLTQQTGQCVHFGLSTDPKPVNSPQEGHVFIEIDTGKFFLHEGGIWVEKFNESYKRSN